jgi:hypothetical protein
MRVAVAPEIVTPRNDIASTIQGSLQAHDHRGPVRLPGELVLARPLQAHRQARREPREQRRVERDVVGAIVAVAAGTLRVLHDHLLLGHAQHQRDFLAQVVDPLRVRPDLERAALQPRERARRPDRGVADERLAVFRGEVLHAARFRRCVGVLLLHLALGDVRLQPGVDVFRRRRAHRSTPALARSFAAAAIASSSRVGEHADEAAVTRPALGVLEWKPVSKRL